MRNTAIYLAAALAVPTVAFAQTAPSGWKTEHPAQGVVTDTPVDLQAGEFYTVTVYPSQSFSGKPIEGWIASVVENDSIRAGQLKGTPKIEAKSANIAYATGSITTDSGEALVGIYYGVSMDREKRINIIPRKRIVEA